MALSARGIRRPRVHPRRRAHPPAARAGDVLTDLDAVRAQVRCLVRAGDVDTVCVHGDGVHALPIARAVREALA